MSIKDERIGSEAGRRRTFAIISHPDAGKTTLTEKLLLYGGAIRLAGAVKERRASRHATSDWMELEKQRGISVTSSVLQFNYEGLRINLLDTPGHQDFSEDTYRTLAAADAAVMILDCAKGVETQTEKLFKVCRMRQIPIFTFVNKLDREGLPPLDLLSEIEQVLGINACPVHWPLGMGKRFKGVYDLIHKRVLLFSSESHGQKKVDMEVKGPEDPAIKEIADPHDYEAFIEETALLEGAGEELDLAAVRAGQLTPVFFGSAMTNFGVEPFLREFVDMAPPPAERLAGERLVEPGEKGFSAFVFKIQANMNPQHRDRIAFMRICSGRFEKGIKVRHQRLGRDVSLALPMNFMANDRTLVEEAWPGDVIGVHDRGTFRIGDTVTEASDIVFDTVPMFSPEHFARVRLKNALKSKQLNKGLEQLGEEGAIQVFRQPYGDKDPIVGAVGMLQFDVLTHRLEGEYGVTALLEPLPYTVARWVEGEAPDSRAVDRDPSTAWCVDRQDRGVILFKSQWAFEWLAERNPDANFLESVI